jgi:hypothetical protein
VDKVRRDFYARRKSNRGHAKPEQFAPEKQNHRPKQDAQNWNGEVHGKGVVVVVIDSVIPSEVEESLSISEISRDVSTLLDMTGSQNKSASPFWKGRGLR